MNHDYAHCLDYTKDCPKECFRAELQRDIEENRSEFVGVPLTYAHLGGTDECKLAKDKDVTCKMSLENDCVGRQSAIKEIARWMGYIDEDMIWRIQTGLKKLPSTQRWIPVSERLPKPDEEVFVYLWGNAPHLASVNSEGQWETDRFYLDADDAPRAWMPLPKPWKGE